VSIGSPSHHTMSSLISLCPPAYELLHDLLENYKHVHEHPRKSNIHDKRLYIIM